MPRHELDATPVDNSDSDLLVILKNLPTDSRRSSVPDSLVSQELYETLMKDRPGKFNEKQVGFKRNSEGNEKCGACVHWFQSPAAKRSVCEIFRPKDDSSVNAEDTCEFYTPDGTTFPKLTNQAAK